MNAAPTTQYQTDPKRDSALALLLTHGRRLAETVGAKGKTPQFASIGLAFGTHDLPVILARIERGTLRLLALDAYLMQRAGRGRSRSRTAKPPKGDIPKIRRRRPAYNPETAHIPSFEEFQAEVRRTPVGRSIARVCLDLGVVPAFCTGEMGNALLQTLESLGGSLSTLFKIRRKREIAFQKERDQRPDTWDWNWRDTRKERMREVLGYLIGEEPPDDPMTRPT
jgi:hypothetical protein